MGLTNARRFEEFTLPERMHLELLMLTPGQCAAYLQQKSPRVIRDWIIEGRLKARKVRGRHHYLIVAADFLRCIDAMCAEYRKMDAPQATP